MPHRAPARWTDAIKDDAPVCVYVCAGAFVAAALREILVRNGINE